MALRYFPARRLVDHRRGQQQEVSVNLTAWQQRWITLDPSPTASCAGCMASGKGAVCKRFQIWYFSTNEAEIKYLFDLFMGVSFLILERRKEIPPSERWPCFILHKPKWPTVLSPVLCFRIRMIFPDPDSKFFLVETDPGSDLLPGNNWRYTLHLRGTPVPTRYSYIYVHRKSNTYEIQLNLQDTATHSENSRQIRHANSNTNDVSVRYL
jgi:hypothetical protein